MRQQYYSLSLTNNADFELWTSQDLAGQLGYDVNTLDEEGGEQTLELPKWDQNLRKIFSQSVYTYDEIETAIGALYNWRTETIKAHNTVEFQLRLLQSGDGDYESPDLIGIEEESICSEQTMDLKKIYENYLLFNSYNDGKRENYVPLAESVAQWMDFFYG